MPICKNCGSRIEKFNKDICPICGEKKPLEGVSSETIEITSQIDLKNSDFKYRQTKKSIVLLLFCLIGFTGAGFFYMKRNKYGIIYMIASLLLIGVGGLCLSLLDNMMPYGFLIALGISYVLDIALGLYLYFSKNIKDGEGEFIR